MRLGLARACDAGDDQTESCAVLKRPGLLAALVAEIAIFSAIAQNFFTLGNFFEVIRTSVEVGLLAIALTPVLISGGIDLSVGSMMGLAAVVFGAALRDWNLGVGGAAIAALLVGCAGGLLNAA